MKRKDAGEVDRTALEMRHTGNRIQGSNPCLSAKKAPLWCFFLCDIIIRGFRLRRG